MSSTLVRHIETLVIQLLDYLRENDFAAAVTSYVDALKITRAYLEKGGTSAEDLRMLLSVVICRSTAEQAKFNELFESFVLKKSQEIQKKINDEEGKKNKRLQYWLAALAISLLGAVALALYFDTFNFFSPKLISQQQQNVFQYVGEAYSKPVEKIVRNPRDTTKLRIKQQLVLHGLSTNNFSSRFILNDVGVDTFVTHLSSDKYQLNQTYTDVMYVGPENGLSLEPGDNNVYLNTEIIYRVKKDDTIRLDYSWYVNDSIQKDWHNRDEFRYRYNAEGYYTIKVAYRTEKDSFLKYFPPAFYADSLVQRVLANTISIDITSADRNKQLSFFVRNEWWWLLAALALASLILWIWAYRKFKKIKKDISLPVKDDETLLKELQSRFSGQEAPHDIVYYSRPGTIHENVHLRKISRHLAKVVESPVATINWRKTIRKTILNNEFISPVFQPQINTLYYLVLVNKEYATSQQFALFRYLVQYFIRRSVSIDFYYYHNTPDVFYKFNSGVKTVPAELYDNYHQSVLMVLDTGYGFLDERKPILKPLCTAFFFRWNERILVTPVPYNDWGAYEKILNNCFEIVPADISGLLEVVRLIQENKRITDIFNQDKYITYSASGINFESIDAVKSYLDDDDDLIQWLCALAVYPKISWEVSLEIGKNILGTKAPEKITYEHLLRLARIKWMNEGRFTSFVRVMLLKELSTDNELKARATVLKLLDEIQVDNNASGYEEKMVNKYNNSFVLYAAGIEKQSVYSSIYDNYIEIEANALEFIRLYQGKVLTDTALKVYLEKSPAQNQQWNTPVTRNNKNVSLQDFVKGKEARDNELLQTRRRKYRFIQYACLGVMALVLLLGILSIVSKKDIHQSFINNLVPIIDTLQFSSDSSLINILLPGKCVQQMAGNNGVPYTIARNNQPVFADTLLPSDSIVSPYGLLLSSARDSVSISFEVGTQTQRRVFYAEPGKEYQLEIRAPDCPLDTVTIYYSAAQQQKAFRLRDTLQAFNYYVSGMDQRSSYNENLIEYTKASSLATANRLQEIAIGIAGLKAFTVQENKSGSANRHIQLWLNDVSVIENAVLPSFLAEIWHGGTSNRLLTINLARNVLYYSVNDTKTYGTYNIDEVELIKKDLYRIITKTTSGYKLFFIRNPQAASFELSVCQDFASTKEELQNKDESFCDRFNTMQWYYENDPAKIFYPANRSYQLAKSEVDKMEVLAKNLPQQVAIVHYEGMNGYPANLSGELLSAKGLNWKAGERIGIVNPSPFQRDYDVLRAGTGGNILWVGDYPENNKTEIALFEQNGIKVDLVKTNEEAYQLISKKAYAYVITDIERTNAEPCVVDKNKAGVAFAESVSFPRSNIIVYAPEATVDKHTAELNAAGIPQNNQLSNSGLLRAFILKNIGTGNTRTYSQKSCTECKPSRQGNRYILYYAKQSGNFNQESTNLLDELLQRVSKNTNYKIAIASFASSGTTADENRNIAQKNAESLKQRLVDLKLVAEEITIDNNGDVYQQKGNNCDRVELVLTEKLAMNRICDTVNSYIGKSDNTWLTKGTIYENIPLKQDFGITLTLTERSTKAGTFTFSTEKCPVQKVVIVPNQTAIINLCDYRTLYFTLKEWKNMAGDKRKPEAVFVIRICNEAVQQSNMKK